MKRNIFLTVALALCCGAVFASRPLKRIYSNVQSDGKTVNYIMSGDVNAHSLTTTDGYAIVRNADGNFVYAYLDENNEIQPSAVLAHNATDRIESENAYISNLGSSDVVSKLTESYLAKKAKSTRAVGGSTSSSTINTSKTKNILVILAEFSNLKFNSGIYTNTTAGTTTPKEFYTKFFNEENFTAAGSYGSVRDYFKAQSSGSFAPEFKCYGPYTMSKSQTYYGKDNGTLTNLAALTTEAVQAAVKDGVSLADFDGNGDKVVDMVCIVFPGEGGADSDLDNVIWPKTMSGTIGSGVTSNGVKYSLQTAQFVNEYYLDNNGEKVCEGIGLTCHEFSHALGIPDMYYTGNTQYFGLDAWSLMDYGCYNFYTGSSISGSCPIGYTAYEKNFMGWLSYTDVAKATTVTDLKSTNAGGTAYRIVNPSNSDQYLILENHQCDGWNEGQTNTPSILSKYMHGLMIMKVDYSSSVWSNNQINSTSNQRCTLIPADGMLSYLHDGNSSHSHYTSSTMECVECPDTDEGTIKFFDKYIGGLIGDLYPGTVFHYTANGYTTGGAVSNQMVSTSSSDYYYKYPIKNITENTTTNTVSFTIGDTSTGIATASVDDMTVSVDDGAICATANGCIDLYRANGILVASAYNELSVNVAPGLYIVKCGSTARKVYVGDN